MPLGRKIFVGTALVVVAALGAALLVTRTRTNAAAEAASARALRATRSAISDALASRSREPSPAHRGAGPGAGLRLPNRRVAPHRRPRQPARPGRRAAGRRPGADWVLIVDGSGVLKAWTAQRGAVRRGFLRRRPDRPGARGPDHRGALDRVHAGSGRAVPGGRRPRGRSRGRRAYGVVVAALRIDSTFAAQLQRHTGSEILFFSRDTAGIPTVAVATVAAERPPRRRAPAPGRVHTRRQRARPVPAGRRPGSEYEGVTGLLQTADGVPIGGYVGLHDRQLSWPHGGSSAARSGGPSPAACCSRWARASCLRARSRGRCGSSSPQRGK